MVDRPYLESRIQGDQLRRARADGALWQIRWFAKAFVRTCAGMGVPVFPHTIVRTASEQTEAYVRGVTNAKAGQSAHNFGCAVDLVHSVQAWDLSERQWRLLGHIGKEIAGRNGLKLQWGGDWNSLWDPAHWEVENWRDFAPYYPFPKPPKGGLRRWRLPD